MAELTEQEKNALKSLLKGLPIDRAKKWLLDAHIHEGEMCGWPHLTAQGVPSVWGGTLDGVIALTATGMSRYDPVIKDSVDWIFRQQREDGGFGSREMTYSASESTAWVIISLKNLGFDTKINIDLAKAVAFLEGCVTTSGEVGTSLNDEPRIYPALVTMWALAGYSDKAKLIARYLKDSRDISTGGWGVKENTKANPAKTAQVLHALLQNELLDPNDAITHQAVDYIIANQQGDGGWANYFEEWYSQFQPHIPLRHNDHTITWAIRALVSAGVPVSNAPLAKAIDWLIRNQAEEGYWLFEPLDDSKYIWCITGSMLALSNARQKLIETITEKGPPVWESADRIQLDKTQGKLFIFWKNVRSFITNNITNIGLVALALYVFGDRINAVISEIVQFLQLQRDSIMSDLVSAGVWALLVLFGTFILNKIRSGRS